VAGDRQDRGGSEPSPGLSGGVWPLVGAKEMQALDQRTIEGRGIPGEVLMESAGRALVGSVVELRALSSRSHAMVRIFCGAGNNGGDGFVLARHLVAEGIAAETILIGEVDRLPKDAASNWARLKTTGAAYRVVDPQTEGIEWRALLAETSVAVDAIFGVGLAREVGGPFAHLIDSLCEARRSGLLVLAVDMPSGVAAETGQVQGVAVMADRTLTISLPKVGLALEPGRSHAGEIEVARIGIDDPDPQRLPRIELWNVVAARRELPDRPREGHKGTFGRVLVIAGSRGMMGAGVLCTRAALRSGAGLVTLAHPDGRSRELGRLCAEVMTAAVPATEAGSFARAGEKELEELAAARDVVAIGPGLGRAPETSELVRRLLAAIDRPIVLDADGLYGLADQLEVLRDRSATTILTPHPGEAAHLLSSTIAQVNADRIAAARRLAELSGSIVVLKGAGTVIANADGRTIVNSTGGPSLASGGTGDVLTGIVAALLASQRPAFEAAALAAWWHGASADRLDSAGLGFGLLASEVADGLPHCVASPISPAPAPAEEEAPHAGLVLRFPGP
jgi:hydroxyethylthiazole kinase-like uncharacterized protein yjeF